MIFALILACAGDPDDTADEPQPGDPDYERDPALDVEMRSEAGSTDSHNTGEACMHCHQAHGNGLGQFTAAGSAYTADGQPASEGTIQLWSADGAAVVVELPIDAFGNFYTTEDFGLPEEPVQPAVVDAQGNEVNRMPWTTESASCNQCHTPVRRVEFP